MSRSNGTAHRGRPRSRFGPATDAAPIIDAAPTDATPVDATPAPDAPAEICPGAMETDARRCLGDTSVQHCASGETRDCSVDERCVEYVDERPGDAVGNATCIPAGEALCDPAEVPPSCDGALQRRCQATPGGYAVTHTVDCRERLGYPDATCVADGELLRCESDSSLPCDPETFVPRCDESRRVVCRDGQTVRTSCASGDACFESVPDGEGVCLGGDATPTGEPVYPFPRVVRCDDSSTLRWTSYGYTYTRRCGIQTRFVEGGTETFMSVCVADGRGGGGCVHPDDAQPCDAGSVGPECVPARTPPALDALLCVTQHDGREVLVRNECQLPYEVSTGGTGYTRTECVDAGCARVGPCSVSDPPTCADSIAIRCDPVTELWLAQECTGACVAGSCG